jgi:hypothetical protein
MRNIPIFALRCLRTIFALIMSVLNIPLTQVLFSGVYCVHDYNLKTHLKCSSTSQLVMILFNILGTLAFIPLMLLASLVVRSTRIRYFDACMLYIGLIETLVCRPLSVIEFTDGYHQSSRGFHSSFYKIVHGGRGDVY